MSYDLVGLPPTAAEFDAFAADTSPEAHERVVDRLLASPAYGERWGRHWLDYARYADSKGYLAGGEERKYPNAYKYRDWVVRALNEDMPYDEFLLRQIAADRLPTAADHEHARGARFFDGRAAVLEQQGRHHRRSARHALPHDDGADGLLRAVPRPQVRSDRDQGLLFAVRRAGQHDRARRAGRPDDDGRFAGAAQRAGVDSRQSVHNPGDEVPRQFLPCLAGDKLRPFTDGSGRLELAQAIASRDNPLTARVLVNRVWLHFFGDGSGPHAERFRPAQRCAHASRVARLSGPSLHGRGLVAEEAASADRAVEHLWAIERRDRGDAPPRSRQFAACRT